MKHLDDRNLMLEMFEISELLGNAVIIWSRVEYSLGIIVQRFSSNEKILEKFNNPEKDNPSTYTIIEELKKYTREQYEQFIFSGIKTLESLEKRDMQVAGEYSRKNFDAFIEGLHAARISRNALAHDICKIELEHRHEILGNAIKTDIFPDNFEKIATSIPEHNKKMMVAIGKHTDIISHVATPAIIFVSWLEYTDRMPPPKFKP